MEALSNEDSPDQATLEIFVEFLDHVGITPNYIVGNGDVQGVFLTLECGDAKLDSAPLMPSIPLRAG